MKSGNRNDKLDIKSETEKCKPESNWMKEKLGIRETNIDLENEIEKL